MNCVHNASEDGSGIGFLPSEPDSAPSGDPDLDFTRSRSISSHGFKRIYCGHCGAWHNVLVPCGDRTCPICRREEMLKARRKYLPHLKKIHRPKLLTLTFPNQHFISKSFFKEFRKYWSRLIRRKQFKSKIRGGLFTFEVTNKGNGWHVHAHILIDCDYIPQKSLVAAWKELTGKAFIVDIRVAKNPEIALRYILKYISKSPEIGDNKQEYNNAVRGVRMVQGFGSMYNIKTVKVPMPCKKCGQVAWLTEFEHDLILSGRYFGVMLKKAIKKAKNLKECLASRAGPDSLFSTA